MKILAFTDLHSNKKDFEKVKQKSKNVDLIVCAGDFTIFGDKTDYFLNQFNKLKKDFLLIHGNHETATEVNNLCHKYKHLFFLHKQTYIKDDIVFIGWGGGGFSFKDKTLEKKESYFKKILNQNKDKAYVFVTHAPPYKTKLDTIHDNHCGNKSIRNFIKNNKIDLNICGHIEDNNYKKDKIGLSTVINPGPVGRIINI
jgi:uncharacterized protein